MGHRREISYGDSQRLQSSRESSAMTAEEYRLMKAQKAAQLAVRRKDKQENPTKKKSKGPNKHPRR